MKTILILSLTIVIAFCFWLNSANADTLQFLCGGYGDPTITFDSLENGSSASMTGATGWLFGDWIFAETGLTGNITLPPGGGIADLSFSVQATVYGEQGTISGSLYGIGELVGWTGETYPGYTPWQAASLIVIPNGEIYTPSSSGGSVPEPSTVVSITSGLLMLTWRRVLKRKR